jgi:hypothetical protein
MVDARIHANNYIMASYQFLFRKKCVWAPSSRAGDKRVGMSDVDEEMRSYIYVRLLDEHLIN